jgi:hypothetical protein
MYWYPFWPGAFERAVGGLPDSSSDTHDENVRSSRAGFWGTEQPSALDRWLIKLVYEVVAAEAACSRCGAPLGRGLRVVPSPALGTPPMWRLSVVTRCRGWRRHGYIANVGRPSDDVVLGSFHPGSR